MFIVHHPRYRDWPWPKSKAETNEPIVAAVVCEVEEGAGVIMILHAPLTIQRYRLESGQTKEVHYWVGIAAPGETISPVTRSKIPVHPIPSSEIDQAHRVSPTEAGQPLTRRGDRHLFSEFIARAQGGHLVTTTVVIARHTKAISRHSWHESEVTRLLMRISVRQAIDLADLLLALGTEECVSLPWARRMQTLSPWAGLSGGELSACGELTKMVAEGGPSATGNMIAALLRKIEVPTVLCVHRPTIPVPLKSLEVIAPSSLVRSFPNHSPWLTTVEILVAHVSCVDTKSHLFSLERYATRTKLLFGV